MRAMEPLRIEARLVTPIVVSQGTMPHLDALLAWVAAQRRMATGPCDIATLRALPLPLALDESGVHQASILLGDPAGVAWTQGTVRRTDAHVLIGDATRGLVPLGRRQIDLASGKLRNYVRHLPRQWVRRVVGWAIGDLAAIQEALADVRHVGPGSRADAGRVSAEGWTVTADARAVTRWRWRHLPASASVPDDPDGIARAETLGAVRAPYWDRTTFQVCTVPTFGVTDFGSLLDASETESAP